MKKQTIWEYLCHHQCKFNNMENDLVREVVDYIRNKIKWWQEDVSVEDLEKIANVKSFLTYKNWYWVEIWRYYENNMCDVEDINHTISSMEEVWLALIKKDTACAYDAVEYVMLNCIEHVLKTTIEEIKQLEK